MRANLLVALTAAAALALASSGATAQPAPGKLTPNAKDVSVEATSNADSFSTTKDRQPIPRDFLQQPPLIPHAIRGYDITKNFNRCMDCHSWSRYQETGATKVSITHYKDRDGTELSNISPRRYFCLQCHISQVDAKPLVGNTFQRPEGQR